MARREPSAFISDPHRPDMVQLAQWPPCNWTPRRLLMGRLASSGAPLTSGTASTSTRCTRFSLAL
eukprot:12042723-Prorocentrum_lima.AAC.1